MSEWKDEQRQFLEKHMRGDEISKASKLPKDELTNYPEIQEAFEDQKWLENYKRQQLVERVKKLREARAMQSKSISSGSGVVLDSKIGKKQQHSLEAKRNDTMQEQKQMTMYLMQLQAHPKQFKEIMNKHLKQKKLEGQVISSKENKVKLLDA